MAELVYAFDLKSNGKSRTGSSPVSATTRVMKKKILVVIAILAVVAGILFLVFRGQGDDTNTADSIHAASEGSGFISEKIIGNPDAAKLIVYEYADYGCSHCAAWNRKINDFVKEYGDKFVLVFRAYDIGQFDNSDLASRAATAAQLQGFFKEYKDLLFNNQSEWMYLSDAAAEKKFAEYFEEASSGEGDVNKFKEDISNNAVRKRVDFEQRMGGRAKVKGTPTFRIDGEKVELTDLAETIKQKMAE